MANVRSAKIPKGMEGIHATLTEITDRFCAEHLSQEYADLAQAAIAALCRKRPSPLNSGSPRVWACSILLALGQTNFLSDKSSKPYMATADLRGHFGVAESTASNKAKQVRTLLNMRPFDHRWILPSKLSSSSLPWMIQVNGMIVDARSLPMEIQAVAVKKGLIPYVYQQLDEEAI
jgi:hypothetical protein